MRDRETSGTIKATLYNKEKALIDVFFSEDGHIENTGKVYCKEERFWPVCLAGNIDPERMNKWLGKRRIPHSNGRSGKIQEREGFEKVKKEFPDYGSWKTNRNEASLSDQYWFKFTDDESWDSVNFFTNFYSAAPGLAFFEPWDVDESDMSSPTPDYTTNGVLRKRWVQNGRKESFLIKGRSLCTSEKCGMPHQDPLCEVLGSMMLDKLRLISHARYEIIADGLLFCCKCKNFVTKDTEFVPASQIYYLREQTEGETFVTHMIRMFSLCHLPKPQKYMEKLMAADYIMCNYDRHLGNFGALRDVNSGQFTGYAPVFDYGRSFWDRPQDGIKSKAYLMYKDEQAAAVQNVFRYMDFSKAIEADDMLDLVQKYPYINSERCSIIQRNIKMRTNEMGRAMKDAQKISRAVQRGERIWEQENQAKCIPGRKHSQEKTVQE